MVDDFDDGCKPSGELSRSGEPNPSGQSPFDPLRQVRPNGSEYWSARDLQIPFGYSSWQNFEQVVIRAAVDYCNLNGNADEAFNRTIKTQKSRNQHGPIEYSIPDYHLSRGACYLVAMNCQTEEGSYAKGYFAAQTRRAELHLPPVSIQNPALPVRYWSERLDRSIVAHRRHVIQQFPPGYWSIYTATVTETLILEEEFLRHLLPLQRSDLPDGSIGKRYANHRRRKIWAGEVLTAPLVMPHLLGFDGEPVIAQVAVYGPEERRYFEHWLNWAYLPLYLSEYLRNKFPRRVYGLAPASAANSTCLEITGHPAQLPPDVRRLLDASGGFIPYRPDALPKPRQGELF